MVCALARWACVQRINSEAEVGAGSSGGGGGGAGGAGAATVAAVAGGSSDDLAHLASPHAGAAEDAVHAELSASAAAAVASAEQLQQQAAGGGGDGDGETGLLPPGLPRIETKRGAAASEEDAASAAREATVEDDARAAQLASLAEQVGTGAGVAQVSSVAKACGVRKKALLLLLQGGVIGWGLGEQTPVPHKKSHACIFLNTLPAAASPCVSGRPAGAGASL